MLSVHIQCIGGYFILFYSMSFLFLALEVPSFSFLGLGFTTYFTFTLEFSSSGLQYVFLFFFCGIRLLRFSCLDLHLLSRRFLVFPFFAGHVFPDNLEGTPPFFMWYFTCSFSDVYVNLVYNTETVQGLSPKEEMLASFQDGNQQQRTFRHGQVWLNDSWALLRHCSL